MISSCHPGETDVWSLVNFHEPFPVSAWNNFRRKEKKKEPEEDFVKVKRTLWKEVEILLKIEFPRSKDAKAREKLSESDRAISVTGWPWSPRDSRQNKTTGDESGSRGTTRLNSSDTFWQSEGNKRWPWNSYWTEGSQGSPGFTLADSRTNCWNKAMKESRLEEWNWISDTCKNSKLAEF